MINKSELEAIKKRVNSWPDYKKANYNAIFGEKFNDNKDCKSAKGIT